MHSCCNIAPCCLCAANITSCHGCLLFFFPSMFCSSKACILQFSVCLPGTFHFWCQISTKWRIFLLLPDLQVKVWCKFESFTETFTAVVQVWCKFTGNFHQTFIKLSLHRWNFIASLMQLFYTTASLLKVSMNEWKFAWNFHSWSASLFKTSSDGAPEENIGAWGLNIKNMSGGFYFMKVGLGPSRRLDRHAGMVGTGCFDMYLRLDPCVFYFLICFDHLVLDT